MHAAVLVYERSVSVHQYHLAHSHARSHVEPTFRELSSEAHFQCIVKVDENIRLGEIKLVEECTSDNPQFIPRHNH